MMSRGLLPFIALTALLPNLSIAQASPAQATVEQTSLKCQRSFLDGDADAYMNAASIMMSWGTDLNEDIQHQVDLCFAFSDLIDGVDISQIAANTNGQAAEAPEQDTSDSKISEYLARIDSNAAKIPDIASQIAEDEDFSPAPSASRDALEEALNKYVRPIPARQYERNLTAYQALAKLDPDNSKYQERISRYTAALKEQKERLERTARQLEQRLVKNTADFDGSSWSRHPQSPRYQDIRDYVTLYLLESGSRTKRLQLFVNYTSRDQWLFVQNAQVNIDGDVTRLPVSRWYRDNDTEIWEWGASVGTQAIDIARDIANSERAVIRFNGQQFYDDFVVSNRDKKIMREMLAMWDVITE
jgi:hypothetical protein